MKMLSSKEFTLKDTSFISDWIKGQITFIKAREKSENLPITISITAKGRGNKQAAKDQLKEMAVENSSKSNWKKNGYNFDFLNQRYYWNNQEIHITANEGLYLFRRLVLNDEICHLHRHLFSNIRNRHGRNFLKELENNG